MRNIAACIPVYLAVALQLYFGEVLYDQADRDIGGEQHAGNARAGMRSRAHKVKAIDGA